MGKRGEVRPEVSDKVHNMVAQARQALGKPKATPPRPQASPARTASTMPVASDEPASKPLETPDRAPVAAEPTPMSLASKQSTPIKSPDLKRLKSAEIPAMPLYGSEKKVDELRTPDSCTTLDLADYQSRMNRAGLRNAVVHKPHLTYNSEAIKQDKIRKTSRMWFRTSQRDVDH